MNEKFHLLWQYLYNPSRNVRLHVGNGICLIEQDVTFAKKKYNCSASGVTTVYPCMLSLVDTIPSI